MEKETTNLAERGVATLLGIDWRQAWIELSRTRKEPDDAQYWDGRAREFSRHAGKSLYAGAFIDYLGLKPGLSVLDMGCGNGVLALPLARAGHDVLAVDFSRGMLDELKRVAEREGLDTIRCVQLDFNTPWSEWEAAGITEGCVDVAIASRSTITTDLWASFQGLERVARQSIAITIATEYTPLATKRMGESIDGGPPFIPDYIYAVNVLMQMGRYPSLRYIDSDKTDQYGRPQLVRWAYISWDAKPKM